MGYRENDINQLTPSTPMKTISYKEFHEKLATLKTMDDAINFAKELVAPTMQEMLEAEMTAHLGYEKHSLEGKNTGNSRNGYSKKTIKGSFGEADLAIPRDRNSDFEPQAVKKWERIPSELEEKIIAMYAKGMTTRDINSHVQDIYGIDVSATMVSTITDRILPLVEAWQNRPLDAVYPIIYLDGIHFKVRNATRVMNTCAYTVLGINLEGKKELLGLWIGEAEGAKFWLKVLSEIKERGVQDVFITCVDGLTGFPDAIKTIYPHAQVQRCIIHQVRQTLKFVPHKHKKAFAASLKEIYRAPTEESALIALKAVKERWVDYALYLKSWEKNWTELATLFQFPEPIRKMIYTTNAVESTHRQLRKITKTTSVFPHTEALKKLLWLGMRDLSKKWTMSVHNWGQALAQFAILFPERIDL